MRQLVLKLLAMGRVRIGDPDRILLIVARREDPSVLLSYPEERVLSSLPRADETTPSLVATALQMPLSDVVNHLASLCRKIAVETDDLSLLANVTAKERQKLNGKGIFTVTQLSYTF